MYAITYVYGESLSCVAFFVHKLYMCLFDFYDKKANNDKTVWVYWKIFMNVSTHCIGEIELLWSFFLVFELRSP